MTPMIPETYENPGPEEERKRVEFDAPLTEKFHYPTQRLPKTQGMDDEAGYFVAGHFTHPNGEEGILLVYRGEVGVIADAFDFIPENGAHEVVTPFKHKADGGFNFLTYEATDGSVAVTMTAEMYDDLRTSFIEAFGAQPDPDR